MPLSSECSGQGGHRCIAGKFKLSKALAEGGMGVVWAGRNEAIGLDVAIKLLHRHLDGEMAGRRLQREAQVAARLSHPALVRVYDFGIEDGQYYLVMEHLSGRTLSQLIDDEGPVSPTLAVRMLLPIAAALETLHRHGVVHRDIKPDNIMLARDDSGRQQPKLLDFGVAQIDDPRGDFGERPEERGPVGTPGYLAPEQALSEPVDGRADVWGLCVSLFEAIAGEPLFGGDGLTPIIATRRPAGAIHVEASCPSMPAELAAIIDRGLASQPAQRWSSMRVLRVELADWLEAQGVSKDAAGVSLSEYASSRPPSTQSGMTTPRVETASPPADDRDSLDSLVTPRRRWRSVSFGVVAAAAVVLGGAVTVHRRRAANAAALQASAVERSTPVAAAAPAPLVIAHELGRRGVLAPRVVVEGTAAEAAPPPRVAAPLPNRDFVAPTTFRPIAEPVAEPVAEPSAELAE